MNFTSILNMKAQYITRVVLTILMLSNIFYINSFYWDRYKKSNSSEIVIEAVVVQDVNTTIQKTTKTQLQRPVKILSLALDDKLIFTHKEALFIKTPVLHFSVLNFQFFLSSQFSTDT